MGDGACVRGVGELGLALLVEEHQLLEQSGADGARGQKMLHLALRNQLGRF